MCVRVNTRFNCSYSFLWWLGGRGCGCTDGEGGGGAQRTMFDEAQFVDRDLVRRWMAQNNTSITTEDSIVRGIASKMQRVKMLACLTRMVGHEEQTEFRMILSEISPFLINADAFLRDTRVTVCIAHDRGADGITRKSIVG